MRWTQRPCGRCCPAVTRRRRGRRREAGTLADRVAAFEREVVLAELNAHGHRVAETARALGLERSHLYKKCQQLGIDMKAERK